MMVEIEMEIDEIEKVEIQPAKLKQELNNNEIAPKGSISPQKKHPKKIFQYGNYPGYYSKRNGVDSYTSDIRLEMLISHQDLLNGKRVLDIGCNDGLFTISLVRKYCPKSMHGLDIDGDLINRARNHVVKARQQANNTPKILNSLLSTTFRKANYILKEDDILQLERSQYDTILCLSVTKWIHLNFGDRGIKFLFQRIFKQLYPNGALILESQSFDTYKRRRNLTPEIQTNAKNIQLFPKQFKSYLMGPEVGFSEYFEIGKTNHKCQGFNRLLQVFIKN